MASKIDALPLRMKTVVLNLGTKIDDLPSLAPLLVALLFITLATSLVFLSIVVVTFVNTARRRKIELPGPEGWPLIGVSLNLPTRPRKILNTYRKKYGDAFKIRMGWYDWVFFNTPEGVKEVFDKQSAVTSHKVALPMAHDYVMRDQGILSMGYTMKWRKMRTYMHQLLSPKASLAFVPSQEFEIKQLLYDFSRDEGKVSTDFYMYIRRMTFSIMMTSTYGQRIPEWDCQEVRDVYGNMRILSIILSPGTFWMDIFPPLSIIPKFLMPSFYKARWCRNFMQENTMRHWNNLKEKYEKGVAPECFAKHIMDSDYQSQGLSEETVSWLAHAIPEAGAETTASALNSLIMHLAAFPDAQERAAEECTRILGDGRLATLDDEPEMPYIRAVIKEILRMCPVATTGLRRQAGGDVHYNGTIIPKGTILLANINALHWDEDRFSNPFSFQPERYLSHTQRSAFYANSGDVSQRDHFTFGAGRRICPGVHLAENGLFLAVANLIWAYEFRAPLGDNGQEIKIDIGDEAFSDGAIRIPKPYKIRIIPRNEKRLALVKGIWEKAKAEGYVMRGLNVSESIGIDVK